jgi:hypothetical protein
VVEGGAHNLCAHAELGVMRARAFSLLKNMFSDEHRRSVASCLGGMLQGSLMLRHNKRKMRAPAGPRAGENEKLAQIYPRSPGELWNALEASPEISPEISVKFGRLGLKFEIEIWGDAN